MKKVVPLEGFGGGGTPLNFKIVAYATEEELAAAQPKENTIGVITDVSITGYKFSATEPENMNEGEVWICTDNRSDVAFDIVDGTTLYPISAKQYISNTLVDVIAMSYLSGEWKSWFKYIYKDGNEFEDITGGWTSSGYTYTNGTTTITITSPTKNTNKISFQGTAGGSGKLPGLGTAKAIDLTNINTIEADINVLSTATSGANTFYISVLNNKNFSSGYVAGSERGSGTGEKTVKIDVSALSGSYYIGATMIYDANASVELLRIRMK